MRLIWLLLTFAMATPMTAQVTRKKMLISFHKATTYNNAGNPDKAIATLKEIAELAPMYPDTYLRMAEIYDQAGNKESAVVMLLCPWDSPGKNNAMDCHFLLQGIFLTRDQTCVFWLTVDFLTTVPPGKPCFALKALTQHLPKQFFQNLYCLWIQLFKQWASYHIWAQVGL